MKSQGLEIARAKCASVANIDNYFKELITKYGLKDKPHLIFNVDEKGITPDHSPPHVVTDSSAKPPAVKTVKSQTITSLGCGSASGYTIPPYFVFPGKRFSEKLMQGATPGAAGCVSESVWSNSEIFKSYLKDHFIKYVPGRTDDHVLLLFDGHKSHISVDVITWAQSYNIIMYVLPAHTSHILQPLDVGCYGPFQRIYNNECHKTMYTNSSVITRYNVCEIACKVYPKAFSPTNLQSAYKKAGVFPLDRNAVSETTLAPAEVFNFDTENAQLEVEINYDNIKCASFEFLEAIVNDDETDIVSYMDINETNASVTLNQKECDFFTSKDQLKAIKSEEEKNKKRRNTMEGLLQRMGLPKKCKSILKI